MYHFLDRLVNTALPRIRDFRGLAKARVGRPRKLLYRYPGSRLYSRRSTTTRLKRFVVFR